MFHLVLRIYSQLNARHAFMYETSPKGEGVVLRGLRADSR